MNRKREGSGTGIKGCADDVVYGQSDSTCGTRARAVRGSAAEARESAGSRRRENHLRAAVVLPKAIAGEVCSSRLRAVDLAKIVRHVSESGSRHSYPQRDLRRLSNDDVAGRSGNCGGHGVSGSDRLRSSGFERYRKSAHAVRQGRIRRQLRGRVRAREVNCAGIASGSRIRCIESRDGDADGCSRRRCSRCDNREVSGWIRWSGYDEGIRSDRANQRTAAAICVRHDGRGILSVRREGIEDVRTDSKRWSGSAETAGHRGCR